MKNYILIGVIVVVFVIIGYFIYQFFLQPTIQIREPIANCKINTDCEKYHGCTEMICANQDPINKRISEERLKNCQIDITLYDPPGAFLPCECLDNNCKFVTEEIIRDTVRLCEVENPRFDYREECQKVINEKYPEKECTFEIVNIIPMSLGSCGECAIQCK